MTTASLSTNELLKFLRRLRAVKEYTADPIDSNVIEDILEVGRWSGSGGNRQPTEVVVIRDAGVKRKFGEWDARPAAGAGAVFLLVSTSEQSAFDEGRMAERLLLAAAAHGLGSTVATLKNEGPDEAKKLLGIPEDRRARTVVAVGYPVPGPRPTLAPNMQGGRKPLDQYAHWDRFS
jgi:nitroreductase